MTSLVAIIALALVHVFVGRLRILEGTPRSAWLSIAGGVSVAYVFVHLLPELNEAQVALEGALAEELAFLEHHVYLLALVGLALFYGLERAAVTARRRPRPAGEKVASPGIFWLHVISFAAYNALIGYLIQERGEDEGNQPLMLFAIAMGLHFVANDYGLRGHYRGQYDRIARWVFAAAVLLGWMIGLTGTISEEARSTLLALLAGGVVLNVLKEELPEERESRFWAFAIGAAAYTALLLAI